MTLTITKNKTENCCVLSLAGRIDTTTALELQPELEQAIDENKKVALDFAEAAYVSSAGLRVILAGEKRAKARGSVMTLINVSKDIMEVFDMTGFTDILKFE
ncbi:MAG: STAS domain-containing protein [Clostridiales bacterium]|jgi:anti-anti-sigma factor|nr:STAS domain-containing protein [Clostridiales bacterium]